MLALYDIHGNVRALEAVLTEASDAGADLVVVGGDVASGPWPRQTIDLLKELSEPVVYIRGNADRELLEWSERPGATQDDEPDAWSLRDAWTASQLTDEDRGFLSSFVQSEVVAIEGLGATLFCHATPDSDDTVITPLSGDDRARRLLGGTDAGVVVCGHTHMQFDVHAAGKRLVNPGSVGMPYEGRPGAFWGVIGRDVSLRHTVYDTAAAAEEILGSGYPGAEEFVAEYVVHSYPRDETMRFFEARAERT